VKLIRELRGYRDLGRKKRKPKKASRREKGSEENLKILRMMGRARLKGTILGKRWDLKIGGGDRAQIKEEISQKGLERGNSKICR